MSAVKFKFSGDSAELLKELENIKEKIRGASEQAAKVSPGKGAAADVEGLGASFKKLLPSVTAAVAGVASFGTALSVIKMGIKDAMDDEYMAVQLSSYTKTLSQHGICNLNLIIWRQMALLPWMIWERPRRTCPCTFGRTTRQS